MARNGYKIVVYLDDNPNSVTYMETYEERVLDESSCPLSDDDLVLVATDCEIGISGYTGYRLFTYYNRTTGEYVYIREEDPECEPSSTDEQWVNSGDPYCETTEQGLNTGYMLQLQVQMNPNTSTYGQTRIQRYKSPLCADNSCSVWEMVSKQCHISVENCVATFDGTADVVEIDANPLSTTYNQTRTVNKEDSDCENCTHTTFSWVLVGDMCGDDPLLCNNGIQQTSTNSYTVSRKYKTIGTGTPVPMDEYQVVLKTEDDEDCGYIRPQYEMRIMTGQYICDYETYTKYEKWCKYVSYDSGVTWSLVIPEVCESGSPIAYDSYDCGKPMYRWVPNGDFTCVDNGNDGKIVYWDENSVMTSAYTCDENDYLTRSHYLGMTAVLSGITSPDGYWNTYQVGDCITTICGSTFIEESFVPNLEYGEEMPIIIGNKLWLGDYTEYIGESALQGYDRVALDIPEKVNNMRTYPFGITTYDPRGQCWNLSYDPAYFSVIVMHPETPPLMNDNDLPPGFIYAGNDSFMLNTVIFVPSESYDLYAEVLPDHVDKKRGRLLPMNNDTVSYKAILGYRSDFSRWNYYVPDGSDETDIDSDDIMRGLGAITSVTLTNKIKSVGGFGARWSNPYTITKGTKRTFLDVDTIVFPNSVERIEASAFEGAKFNYINLPSSIKYIGSQAFFRSKYSGITFNEGLEEIGNQAFYYYPLSSVTIPDSVKTIGKEAFMGDEYKTQLRHITIGSGCTSIGEKAFLSVYDGSSVYCTIESVTVRAVVPPDIYFDSFLGSNIFGGSKTNGVTPIVYYPAGDFTIYVPCEAYEAYLATNWNWFNHPSGNTHIECFGECVNNIKAVLTQSDGSTVNIGGRFGFMMHDNELAPYSSTTVDVVLTEYCTGISSHAFSGLTNIRSMTIDTTFIPIGYNGILTASTFPIYVRYSEYDEFMNDSEWSKYGSRIIPFGSPNVEVTWNHQSTVCETITGQIIEITTPHVLIDGVEVSKDAKKREAIGSGCFFISKSSGLQGSSIMERPTSEIMYETPTTVVFSASTNFDVKFLCKGIPTFKLSGSSYNMSWVQVNHDGKQNRWRSNRYETDTREIICDLTTEERYVYTWNDGGSKIMLDKEYSVSPKIVTDNEIQVYTSSTYYYTEYRMYTKEYDGNPVLTQSDVLNRTLARYIRSAYISDSVTSIGNNAFDNCTSLTSVTIPNSVTSIGSDAFNNCTGLTSVYIPSGVTSIGYLAFSRCSGLTNVAIGATTPPTLNGSNQFGYANNYPIYVPASSVDSYKAAWTSYASRIQAMPSVTVYKWVIDGLSCNGFDKCIVERKTVSYNSGFTWENTSETRLYNSGYNSFEQNTPDCGFPSVKFSATYANGNTYTVDTQPYVGTTNNVLTAGETDPRRYYGWGDVVSYVMGDCIKETEEEIFQDFSGLTSVTISSNLSVIKKWAFEGCTNLVRINNSANGVLDIPNNVSRIGNGGFAACYGFTSLIIPNSVTELGYQAFAYCNNLTRITCLATTPPTMTDNTVFQETNNCPIYVPAESVETYKATSGWSSYASRIFPISE